MIRKTIRYALFGTLFLVIALVLAQLGCSNLGRMPSSAPGGTHPADAEPGSLPNLDEEVWVIVRPAETDAPPDADDTPGTGALLGLRPGPGGEEQVPLPLAHTDVEADISAYIASVTVNQRFQNPFESKIEAVYVFPLPQNAAVTGFVMTVGERRIRAIIREREEAERVYKQAKSQGYVASLLTQERPNVFTQKVANIEPGKMIDVDVTYFHTLTYDDGWYEYVFPMVVGPRFNPPCTGDGVGAVARGHSGGSGQATEVSYLAPHERSGHDVSLAVNLDAGVTIEAIECRTHRIDVHDPGSERTRIVLRDDDTIPNKDFVLRYRLAGDHVKTAILTHEDDRGGHFAFMLFPPRRDDDVARSPMELVFVLDCSGSMSGEPIKQSRDAVHHALEQLQPQDTFQIIRFSNDASALGPAPLPATTDNVRAGHRYLASLRGGGGTMMIEGIKAALDFPHDPERLRFVVFLTDGYIGNEREILSTMSTRLGDSRVFSFGVGTAPNRYLLNRMAGLGRGAVAYLDLRDDGAEVMDRFFARASRPVMTDVTLDFGDADVTDLIPAAAPDLFVGRPVVVTGRFRGRRPSDITVQGRVAGNIVESRVEVDPAGGDRHAALASVWARARIAELNDWSVIEPGPDLPRRIRTLALEYGLLSQYTAFVAVDASAPTAGTSGTTVPVAVPVPEGVRYDTTVRQ